MAAPDRRHARPFTAVVAVTALGVGVALLAGGCGGGVEQAADTTGRPVTTSAATAATADAPAATSTTAAGPDAADAGATTTTAAADIPPADPPGNLGDDPQLDALADDCFNGRFAACDQLFFDSDEGSSYEAYGDSCGRRNEPAGLCVSIYGPG